MRKWGLSLMSFLPAYAVGEALMIMFGLALGDSYRVTQRNGVFTLGVAFVWAPVGGLILGIIGAWFSVRRINRGDTALAAGRAPPPLPWGPRKRWVVGFLVGAGIGYFVGRFLVVIFLTLRGSSSFETSASASFVTFIPLLCLAIGVVLGTIAGGVREREGSR